MFSLFQNTDKPQQSSNDSKDEKDPPAGALWVKDFRAKHTWQERLCKNRDIRQKYPDRIPILVDAYKKKGGYVLKQHKFLCPKEYTLGQFLFNLMKHFEVTDGKNTALDSLRLFISDKPILGSINASIQHLYLDHQNVDGFLYMYYDTEEAFGAEEKK